MSPKKHIKWSHSPAIHAGRGPFHCRTLIDASVGFVHPANGIDEAVEFTLEAPPLFVYILSGFADIDRGAEMGAVL